MHRKYPPTSIVLSVLNTTPSHVSSSAILCDGVSISHVYRDYFNLNLQGLTLSAFKWIKCIMLAFAPNPDSMQVQPTSGGGLIYPNWRSRLRTLQVPGLA